MDWDCETCFYCGGEAGNCDCEADGYECAECGHIPTVRELQNGRCPMGPHPEEDVEDEDE